MWFQTLLGLGAQQAPLSPSDFDKCFRKWTAAACAEWKWPTPNDDYFHRAYERLPHGLQILIAHGVASGLIIQLGRQFTLRGLAPKKGPYAWFSRHMEANGPNPNWEHFVQVAEFLRLCTLAARSNLTVTFEDHLMDLAVYDDQRLLVCVEVKERTAQLQDLVKKLRTYEPAVNLSEPDRGNDVTMEGQAVDPGLFNGEHYFKLEPNPGTALIFHLGGDLLGTPGASAQALARRGDEARFRRDE